MEEEDILMVASINYNVEVEGFITILMLSYAL